MSSIDQTQNLSPKRRKTSSSSSPSSSSDLSNLAITEIDITSILQYNIIELPPHDANKKPYTEDQLYHKIKKLSILILVHSKYFIPSSINFYTIIKKTVQFYQKIYSLSPQVREKTLNCINLQYSIAKIKFEFYESNTTIAKELHKFKNTLSYKEFSLDFLRLLIKTPIYVIQQSSGLSDFNIVLKNCFKYYFQNCRHQFCNIFDDNDKVLGESYSLDNLFSNVLPINFTKKSMISIYDNVPNLPDCPGF